MWSRVVPDLYRLYRILWIHGSENNKNEIWHGNLRNDSHQRLNHNIHTSWFTSAWTIPVLHSILRHSSRCTWGCATENTILSVEERDSMNHSWFNTIECTFVNDFTEVTGSTQLLSQKKSFHLSSANHVEIESIRQFRCGQRSLSILLVCKNEQFPPWNRYIQYFILVDLSKPNLETKITNSATCDEGIAENRMKFFSRPLHELHIRAIDDEN